MLVNSPKLPNIDAIADTSRGKRSALADLRDAGRPGRVRRRARATRTSCCRATARAASRRWASAPSERRAAARHRLRLALARTARTGPWAGATRLRLAGADRHRLQRRRGQRRRRRPSRAPCRCRSSTWPRRFLLAFGAEAALLRQRREGGSWQVQVSLARTALWLRSLGRVADGFDAPPCPTSRRGSRPVDSGFGRLAAIRHAARLLGDAGTLRATLGAARAPIASPGTEAPAGP